MTEKPAFATIKLSPAETETAIRRLYAGSMFFGVGETLFLNSFMLLYFSLLGIPASRILLYLSFPPLISVLSLIPFACWAERLGKTRTGAAGLSIGTAAMALLLAAGFLQKPFMEPLVAFSTILYGFGWGMFLTCWMPLISPIVPPERRGAFFGNNRFIYQTATIIFTFAATWALGKNASAWVLQIFLVGAILMRFAGIAFFAKTKELERNPLEDGVVKQLLQVVRSSGYLPFCAYVFLLSLFTGACMALFGLLAKCALKLPESDVMLIGNMGTAGALAGFFAGGRLVDRFGARLAFMFCHFTFAATLWLVPLRGFVPLPSVWTLCFLTAIFGAAQATSSVAISSETLAVMPKDRKAMASALSVALMFLGVSLSGVLASQALKLGMLSDAWALFGNAMSAYDSIMISSGTMILLLVVTLGLVPSVIRPSEKGLAV